MTFPVGELVNTTDPVPLVRVAMTGRLVSLREPDPRVDAAAMYPSTHGSPEAESVWTYLGYGPFPDPGAMADWIAGTVRSPDPLWYTVTNVADGQPLGMVTMMSADAANRRLELGHIWYIPEAHRTGANTETAYLMMEQAFTTFNCRRLEWKCDSLNAPSRYAAPRLGFTYEGTFRNHMIIKGRNRDTSWYSITDQEWPVVRATLRAWLDHPDPRPSLTKMMEAGRA